MPRSKRQPPTVQEIYLTLRKHLPALRERYRVASLGLFGSYVRGEQKEHSDVDILVEFEEPPTLFEFVRLEEDLRRYLV